MNVSQVGRGARLITKSVFFQGVASAVLAWTRPRYTDLGEAGELLFKMV